MYGRLSLRLSLVCAASLLAPVAGTVELVGQPISTLDRFAVARRLAVVPQLPSLPFATTVEQVVALGRLPPEHPIRGLRPADRSAIRTPPPTCQDS